MRFGWWRTRVRISALEADVAVMRVKLAALERVTYWQPEPLRDSAHVNAAWESRLVQRDRRRRDDER